MDGWSIASQIASQIFSAKRSAIPVEHAGEPARAGGIGAVDFYGLAGETSGTARSPADKVKGGAALIASQKRFRQPRQLKEKHVPESRQLCGTAQLAAKAGKMRQVEDHQPVNELGLLHGENPGKGSAPVVRDQKRFGRVGCSDERRYIFHECVCSVSCYLSRRIGAAIAATGSSLQNKH